MLRRVIGAALTAMSLATVPALADTTADQCIAASERGQQLKNAGKLTAAREELATCSRNECPKIVQTDCTKWMGEVLSSLPSIIPAAKDEHGADVVEAKLFVDGKLVAPTFDGNPVAVDPGVHTLRFERAGAEPQEERVVIKAAETNRIVSVTLAQKPAPAPPPAPPPPASHVPVLPIVLGVAGLALGGAALGLDLSTTSSAHDLRTTCAPRCAQSDVDDLHTKYAVSGVLVGVGAAAIVVAGVLYFRTRSSNEALAHVLQGTF